MRTVPQLKATFPQLYDAAAKPQQLGLRLNFHLTSKTQAALGGGKRIVFAVTVYVSLDDFFVDEVLCTTLVKMIYHLFVINYITKCHFY